MKLLSNLRSLFSLVFRRSRVENEMEDELRFHIQSRADDLERSGLSRVEAERQARIEFGAYEKFKEECRETIGVQLFERTIQDVRFGWRVLRTSPGFTTVAVLTLALGIGANTAIFSLVDAVMMRLLRVQKPEELVQLKLLNPKTGNANEVFTNPLWEQVRDHQNIFSGALAWGTAQFDLAQGGAVHYINGLFASGDYFNVLGVRPAAGRLFVAADDQRGCPAIAVLSYGFWQEHYGGAHAAIGSTLTLNRHPFQVIGIAWPGFYGTEVGSKFDAAVPICSAALFDGKESRLDIRDYWWLGILGRRKPGVTPQQLKAQLELLSPQVLESTLPPNWGTEGQQSYLPRVLLGTPAGTGISDLRNDFGAPLVVLMGVVGLVLLIASANLASLMLARATSRNKEIAIRKALGASRSRLVGQLMTECLLLSLAGAALGLLLARWGAFLLVRYISTGQNRIFLDLSPDARVLGFTAAIALLTTILFGIFPALRSTRVSLMAAMKTGAVQTSANRAAFRPGKWMVASQLAFSLVLVVVAGLHLSTLIKLVNLEIGFDRSNVLLVDTNIKVAGVPPEQRLALLDQIEQRLRSVPGVISVSRSSRVPVTEGAWSQPIEVDGDNSHKEEGQDVFFNAVSPAYFQTLRIPLLAGRAFNETDTKSSTLVAIVNETFAHKFFGNANPIGQPIERIEVGNERTLIQIVGLVRDSKYATVWEVPFPQAFFPASQAPAENLIEFFEVRSQGRLSGLETSVQNAVAQVNKAISLDFYSLAQQVDDSMVLQRTVATLSGFFGALALLLAVIGLYGVLNYLVTQRRNEFGIRVALGAPRSSIFVLVMRELVMILLAGVAIGVAISLLSVHLLQRLIFDLRTNEPTAMVVSIAVLVLAAVFAGYLPARRAMRVDPMAALRYE